MTQVRVIVYSSVLILLPCQACATARGELLQKTDLIAFLNVNVIPMDFERVLKNQTVLVRGDSIVALGPVRSIPVPEAAKSIPGDGRYLIPGLSDMPVHFGSNRSIYRDFNTLYLAGGVTTVLSLGGPALDLQERIESGIENGPTIFTAQMIGARNLTYEGGLRAVREAKSDGYDMV